MYVCMYVCVYHNTKNGERYLPSVFALPLIHLFTHSLTHSLTYSLTYSLQHGAKYFLPRPMVNILNGGKHAGGDLQIQEFMIVPKAGVSFKEVTDSYFHFYFTISLSRLDGSMISRDV